MMSRKGKNTCSTIKSNTTPVKPKNPTTTKHKQPNIDEAEEIDLKSNFRRMFEALKEEFPQRNEGKDKQKIGRNQKIP